MREAEYQARLIKTLELRFPGCLVLKNDSGYRQGIPDLVVFYKDRWAMLEVKQHCFAKPGPNQKYYVDKLNQMSFASFICPNSEAEVLDALQSTFKSRRSARVS